MMWVDCVVAWTHFAGAWVATAWPTYHATLVPLPPQVNGSPEEASRLLLCEAAAVVMRQCLQLLGITVLYRI